VQAIEKFHRFLGDKFRVPVPGLGGRELTLKEIANLLAKGLFNLYRPKDGRRPALATQPPFATSPYWQELLLFYEYFHAETGQGLGAAHQTGWTGLLANLVMRRYRKDIPKFGSRQSITIKATSQERPTLRVA
jgi:hypothetical protein